MDLPACVNIPSFPLQILLRRFPAWRDLPAAVLDEQGLNCGMAGSQRRFEPAGHGEPQIMLAARMCHRQRFELRPDCGRIEDFQFAGGLLVRTQH